MFFILILTNKFLDTHDLSDASGDVETGNIENEIQKVSTNHDNDLSLDVESDTLSQNQNQPTSSQSIEIGKTMMIAADNVIKQRDPVLVLHPSKDTDDRNGYNYDVLLVHLSECDIYFAKNLKCVYHKMSFGEFEELYQDWNQVVVNIPRNKDHHDVNFGIFRRRNNTYIDKLVELSVNGDPDDRNTSLDWKQFVNHLHKGTKHDSSRDGDKNFSTRHNYGIANRSQTKDESGQWLLTQTAEIDHFNDAPDNYKRFHRVS